jgi:hypothetical protein
VIRLGFCLSALIVAGSAAATPPRLPDVPPPAASVVSYAGTPEERDGWRRLLWLDFGVAGNRPPGAIGVHPELPVPGTSWTRGMVRTARAPMGVGDPYLGDYALGADAVFRMTADPGDSLRVAITVGIADSAAGALDVWCDGIPVVSGFRPGPGEFVDVSLPLRVRHGEIALRVRADGCALFAVAGIAVYQPPGEPLHPCLAGVSRRPAEAPPQPRIPDSLAAWSVAGAEGEAVSVLANTCDHLMAERLSEGCFAPSGKWYENSFAVRALLAGARVLLRPELAEAAFACTDRFAAEQEKDGGWSAATFGRSGCTDQHRASFEPASANLADVGSMALALAVAAGHAEGARRDRYLKTLRRYMDRVALPQQLPSGAFPNRMYLGKDYHHPYSVATAVQASALSTLHALTGESGYRRAAERAALFLAEAVDSSGEFLLYPHDAERPLPVPATDLGNTYYVLESLITAHACAGREARARIEEALRRAFEGDEGLFAAMARPDWWRTPELWGASKKAGILFLVDQYGRRVTSDRARVWRDRALALLGEPAAPFGVREDPGGPRGRYAMVATGFAALGAASVLDPDAVVLHR